MIELLRLDERLIHGQVAAGWAKAIKFDTLLVIDDESANDAFLTNTLYMAAPANIKTFVMTTEKAMEVLTDHRCHDRHVFVVVRTIETLLHVAQNAPDIQLVQVSNFGRMVPNKGGERTGYGGHLFLNEDEAKLLKTVLNTGLPCVMQMAPNSPKTELKDLLKNV